MSVTTVEREYKRLRAYLNPFMRGPNVDAVLYSLAQSSAAYLVDTVAAVNDQLYVATASGRYLDQRLADSGITRPPEVGLSDDVFREIGIEVKNRKQVRDLIHRILDVIFGEEYVRATGRSRELEPYNLQDGDTLILQFDDGETAEVTFKTEQFGSIAAAKAQEVADAITRSLRASGRPGGAFAKDDGLGGYVVLISDTLGPSSSVRVRGGRSQNELKFDTARPAGGGPSTQWDVTQEAGGVLRFTWSAGADPKVGKIRVNDYANIYGSSFDPVNTGTFDVTAAVGGAVGTAYFEVLNPIGVGETVVQGTSDAILFFTPTRTTVSSKQAFASAYQAEARLLEVFVPATTRVVRRERRGAAHLHGEALVTESEVTTAGANEITDVTLPLKASIADGAYMIFDTPENAYYVYFDTTGSDAVDPAPGGRIGIRVDVSSAVSAAQVAEAFATAVSGVSDASAAPPFADVARLVNLENGAVADAANVNVTGLSVSVFQQGVTEVVAVVSTPDPYAGLNAPSQPGPYCFDPSQPFTVSNIGTVLDQDLDASSSRVVRVSNASQFPDEQGYLVLGYGTKRQEGPLPYIARPSSGTLLISPAYTIKNRHLAGEDVSLVAQRAPAMIDKDGSDYPFFMTDVVSGRVYAEDLINEVAATGIRIVITVLYPSDEGLGKWGTDFTDITYVFGE